MTESLDWDQYAPNLIAVAENAALDAAKKASDVIYERVLESVQDYFCENVGFNISARLETADRGWRLERERAERLEAEMRELRRTVRADVTNAIRADIAASVRERADWLKSEYSKGGNYEYLRPREEECRTVADMIERGRIG